MRPFILALISLFFAFSALAQAPSQPQTARQALIEMFFGESANHFEKHLPPATLRTLKKLDSGNGQSSLTQLSMLAALAKASGTGIETFDTGPTLLKVEDAHNPDQKLEVTVERDDLAGEEDQIELAFHLSKDMEATMPPFLSRFTFIMKMDSDIWRLNEISVTLRVPLADPEFLKGLEERSHNQNEQITIWAVRSVNTAETAYKTANGSYACDLAMLGPGKQASGANRTYLYDRDLTSGKKNGYVFAISSCDDSHYKIVAEPATPGSGQRALCSDETGTIRASADGKGTTCASSGEQISEGPKAIELATLNGQSAEQRQAASTPSQQSKTMLLAPAPEGARPVTEGVQRVRVSQGVSQGLVLSRVQPIYPEEAKAAGAQGSVVMAAIIGKDGTVQSLHVATSESPLLNQAAIDAVKQWRYKPYILNGNPVEVDTTVTVTFTLTY
jgi:TonB family protein